MKYQLIFLIALMGQMICSNAMAAPAQIVIIRHGEKPAVGSELNTQGWQRANALPQFFENNKIINQFGKPIALYAGAPNKPGGAIRSIQTITPYANQLGMKIHTEIKKDEINALVNVVMNTAAYEGHTVIICWEHSVIPEMAQMFGATSAPNTWDDNVFDRAWVLRYTNNEFTNFQDLPQHLLPTDSLFELNY
jgi:hypothetical protein